MNEAQGRAWLVATATPAAKSANDALRDQRVGFHIWQPRANSPTLKCELIWTMQGGFPLGDVATISTAGDKATCRLNDSPIELGPLAAIDQRRITGLLINFAAQALAARLARQAQPLIGRIRSETGDIAGMSTRGAGRGAGKAT